MTERDYGYDFIRAAGIVFIAVYHFALCVRDAAEQAFPLFVRLFMSGSCNIGRTGVAWFFILSGSVLQKTYTDGVDPRLFYKKRALRMFVPLWIAYAFYYIVSYPVDPAVSSAPVSSILTALLGMDFYYFYFTGSWNLVLVGEWFTSVILTLYLLFPLVHRLFSRYRKWVTPLLLIAFAVNLHLEILTTNDGAWSVVNALVYFWLGMLFEIHKETITGRHIPLLCLFIALGVDACFNGGIFGFKYLTTFIFAICSYIAAYHFSALFGFLRPAVRYFSRLNYEIYLTHHRIYTLLIPALLSKDSGSLSIIFVFITTTAVILLLSEKLSCITARLMNTRFAKAARP